MGRQITELNKGFRMLSITCFLIECNDRNFMTITTTKKKKKKKKNEENQIDSKKLVYENENSWT